MTVDLIQAKMLKYKCQTLLEQEQAQKEIVQGIMLYALSRAGFFNVACLINDAALRLIFNVERYSDNLEFVLLKKNKDFNWNYYFKDMSSEFLAYGYAIEWQNRDNLMQTYNANLNKNNLKGGFITIKHSADNKPKLRLGFNINIDPPADAVYEINYLDFPLPFCVRNYDLPSLFTMKCYTVLTQAYPNGKDWYDIVWHISQTTPINFKLLSSALFQAGPWANQTLKVNMEWFIQAVTTKILNINWQTVVQDMAPYVGSRELTSLELWDTDFFISRVNKLLSYME